MKNIHKMLALVLAVILAFGSVPAMAAEAAPEAVASIEGGEVVTAAPEAPAAPAEELPPEQNGGGCVSTI